MTAVGPARTPCRTLVWRSEFASKFRRRILTPVGQEVCESSEVCSFRKLILIVSRAQHSPRILNRYPGVGPRFVSKFTPNFDTSPNIRSSLEAGDWRSEAGGSPLVLPCFPAFRSQLSALHLFILSPLPSRLPTKTPATGANSSGGLLGYRK